MTRDEFSRLALSYLDELTAFARRLTRNAADSDDLVQATFERAFRSWQSLRDPQACRAWLFRIARNHHLNIRRAAASGPELSLVSLDTVDGPIVSADTIERVAARSLEAALARVPKDQREAVLLCDLWGFEYGEIARITGVPVGTVRSRIARGRARVMALLAEEERSHGQQWGVR